MQFVQLLINYMHQTALAVERAAADTVHVVSLQVAGWAAYACALLALPL